jgi:uridine phosphorylase
MNNSIIEPFAFLKYVSPDILEDLKNINTAFLCFDRGNFKNLKETIPGKPIKGLSSTAWLSDNNVLICGQMGIGAPAAVGLLEELTAAGIKRMISFGTAGALHNGLEAGDLVLCSAAFPGEGTSRHYFDKPGVALASEMLKNQTSKFLAEKEIDYKTAKAWTTDAPFRETPEKLEYYTGQGADVVEMEASALYHVATFRQIELLALFVIGDSISDGKWKPHFYDKKVRDRLLESSLVLIELLNISQ